MSLESRVARAAALDLFEGVDYFDAESFEVFDVPSHDGQIAKDGRGRDELVQRVFRPRNAKARSQLTDLFIHGENVFRVLLQRACGPRLKIRSLHVIVLMA